MIMITVLSLRLKRFAGVATVVSGLLLTSCASNVPANPSTSGTAAASVVIEDQWQRKVTVPRNPQRVVVIEWEGLVTKSMRAFGVDDRLVGVDKPTKQMGFRQTVIPGIANAQAVGTVFSGLNEEQIAALRPDVVFLEAWASNDETRATHQKVIDRLEALKIPTVVLLSPSNFEKPDLSTAWEIVTITGKVFGREADADKMVKRIAAGIDEVKRRIPEEGTRPRAAIFATAKYVMGPKSIQSAMLTSILRADNIAPTGTFVPISEEKLLALDPDVLLIIGHEGYLPVADVLAGRKVGLDWKALGSMKAIKAQRLTSLGYDEWRATVETPVALMKMAKVLYPAQFADVNIADFELQYYKDLFALDETAARAAIKAQEFPGELSR